MELGAWLVGIGEGSRTLCSRVPCVLTRTVRICRSLRSGPLYVSLFCDIHCPGSCKDGAEGSDTTQAGCNLCTVLHFRLGGGQEGGIEAHQIVAVVEDAVKGAQLRGAGCLPCIH